MQSVSDILKLFDLNKFKQRISLSTELCLTYSRKQAVNDSDIALNIGIPHEYLKSWYDLKQSGKLIENSYTEILNAFISQHRIKLKDSERICGIIRRSCGEIKSKCCKLKGRLKGEYLGKIKSISVYQNEIVNVTELQDKIKDTDKKAGVLSIENERINKRYEELLTEIRALNHHQREANQALNSKEKEYDSILRENKALSDYLEKVGIFVNFKNSGKEIPELGKKHQQRKLTELKSHIEKSLWFTETFGLTLKSATFIDKSGSNYPLTYDDTSQSKKYKDLPEQEQRKIKEILFIMDQFCIGEAAYHEVSMTQAGENLPRSYLIKQCKESLNALTHVERTPGMSEGAQLNFHDAVCNEIQKHVSLSR